MQPMPMNANHVRFPLAEPDSGPSYFGDLRILRPGDGGGAGTYLETRVCAETAVRRPRGNALRRRRSTP